MNGMEKPQELQFDIIICGGGTSGCLIANRLAACPDLKILLVEAGRDEGSAPDVLVPGKYVYQLQNDNDGLWQWKTKPQKELNGRELIFLRGRQLGGSSAVNYMALARGPKADYDGWANMTGDEGWKWDNVLPLMKELEEFDPHPPRGFEEYVQIENLHHGCSGPLKVGFGTEMTPGVKTFIDACQEVGIELCKDNNSGNPVGVGLAQFNTRQGIRSYAANAFLDAGFRSSHQNLTVFSNTEVERIIFEGRTAVGVELRDTASGIQVVARCVDEIILCTGTFATPSLLLRSGIGPVEELNRLDIQLVLNMPGVGQGMLDHSILTLEYRVRDAEPDHCQIFEDNALLAEADALYARDRSGPHAKFGTSGSVAFPKIEPLLASEEFINLDKHTQSLLKEASRPSAEIWLGSGFSSYVGPRGPEDKYITHELLLQNNLSRGTVTLQSNKPGAPPLIDPNFLHHPFDKRIAIETVRLAMKLAEAKAYDNVILERVHGPTGKDDDSILDFVRRNLGQGYHSLGTCRMGDRKHLSTVVDSNFAVVGIQGLRIADLSVCPILTCNHTQINAYLIAERCAHIVMNDMKRKSMRF